MILQVHLLLTSLHFGVCCSAAPVADQLEDSAMEQRVGEDSAGQNGPGEHLLHVGKQLVLGRETD